MSHWATDTFLEGRMLVRPVPKQYYLPKDSVSRSYFINLDRYPTRNNLLILLISNPSSRGTAC